MLKLKAGMFPQINLTKVKEIVDDGVVVIDAEKKEQKLAADTVLLSDLSV